MVREREREKEGTQRGEREREGYYGVIMNIKRMNIKIKEI